MPRLHLWLRHEVKPGEERVILTPGDVAKLLEAGFRVSVERSNTRCIDDQEYANAGADLVETGTWVNAPRSTIILGLKELPENKDPLHHRHIYFAHCYKNQEGWKELLQRFVEGNGLLWDLEFLVDDQGRRVAAFGRAAGIVGMALGIYQWANQQLGTKMPALKSWKSTQAMVDFVKDLVTKARAKTKGPAPKALVIGALGRCGGGSCWFADQVGIETTKWDMAETKAGGPFPELMNYEILVNAIYLSSKIPPFVTWEVIKGAKARKLSVFVDVSCDTSNPNNPFPIYNKLTTLSDPVIHLVESKGKKKDVPLDVIAIDHLPSLVPNESSEGFSKDILPHIHLLAKDSPQPVWQRAEKLFAEKCADAGFQVTAWTESEAKAEPSAEVDPTVAAALTFLNHPEAVKAPLSQRIFFLEGKGISEKDILKALARLSSAPAQLETKSVSQPLEAESKAEPKAEPESEPKAEPESEPKAEPESEPKAEPESEPKSKKKAASKKKGAKKK